MADLDYITQDVTVKDDVSGNKAYVNIDHEQLVHDNEGNDWLEAIAGATGGVESKIATSWQFFATNNLAFTSNYQVTLGVGATEQDILLLKNPAASGYDLRIKYFTFGIRTASTSIDFRVYLTPTVTTDGTGLVEVNYHDQVIAGVGEAYSLPTISARGPVFQLYNLNSGGTGLIRPDEDLAVYVEQAAWLLVTAQPTAANKSVAVGLSWAEDDSLHV